MEGAGAIAFFDETKETLALRVAKIGSPLAWGASPRPHIRHMVFNVRATALAGADWFAGRREDVLRRVADALEITKRSIFPDQTVIAAKYMYEFF